MKKIYIATLVATCFCIPAHAEKIGMYVQGNVGSLDSDISQGTCAQIASDVASGLAAQGIPQAFDSFSCKPKGPSGKLVVGYKVTPHFALEGSYFSFGKEVFSAFDHPTPNSEVNVFNLNDKLTAFGIGAALHFDLTENWSVIGRFGFAKTKHKISVDSPVTGASVDAGSESHAKYYAGGGLAYAITPMFKLHGDLDYTKVRLEGYDEHGVRLLSVGGSVNF